MSSYSRYAMDYYKRHNGKKGIMMDCPPGTFLIQDDIDMKNSANEYIRAVEAMEAEKDPKIKNRMRIYIERGIYDFSGIRNF